MAKQHHTGKKLCSATRWDQFIGMAMSQLSGCQSLRDIESNLESQQGKLYHLGAKPIARSTLARLNEKQPAELYQSLFYKLLNRCKQQPSEHKFRFKNPLYSLDASAIDLSISLFPWAAHRDDTANEKLSVALNHGNMIIDLVSLSDDNENDMVEDRKFNFPKGNIVAFDKGYIDYQWFVDLTNKGVSFVTRLRTGAVYDAIKQRECNSDKGILSDQKIELSSAHTIKRIAPTLRLVKFIDFESVKIYSFLTHNLKLSAVTIAVIYKDRW